MLHRVASAVAAVVASAVLATPALAAKGASSGAPAPRVYFRNLNSNTVKPPVLFFAADNGPRMVDIHWYGWGTRRAVGYGAWMARFVGSVGEDELDVRPARVILTDRRTCEGGSAVPAVPHGARFYTGFKLITWDSGYDKHVESYHGC